MRYLLVGCAALIGAVFLAAAGSKAHSRSAFAGFAGSLRELRLFPRRWTETIAVAAVGAEAAVPVLIGAVFAGLDPVAGLGWALLLLLGFSIGIAVAMRRETTVPCRCFGVTTTPLGRRHVVRNLLLAAFAVTGIYAGSAGGPGRVDLPEGIVAAAGGAIVAAAFITFDDLAELFAPARPTLRLARGNARPGGRRRRQVGRGRR